MSGGFLLRAQELLDLADDAAQPIKLWLEQHADATISVSVIGVALARATIATVAEPNERRELTSRLDRILALSKIRTGPALEFDTVAADMWQTLLVERSLAAATKVALQDYALSLTYALTVVELKRNYHDALRSFGVDVASLAP